MSFLSYAQNFEDVLLWRALNDISNGRYLDIGAQDPQLDSVSFSFYQAGWRGVHVEPTPFYAARLREERPDELVVEAAVTTSAGPIKFFDVPETGLSTGRPDIAKEYTKAGYRQREIMVPCVRLDRLFETAGEGDFHWMKVDVEGMEADVLESWGKSKVRPWILVIESTYPNSQRPTQDQWLDEVLRRGYTEVHYDGLSRYFVHESHLERANLFEAPTNIFDNFVVTRRHFVARSLCADLDQAENLLSSEQGKNAQFADRLTDVLQQIEISEGQVTALQSELKNAVTAASDARLKEVTVLAQLAQTEREHRESLESYWRERQRVEFELRHLLEIAVEARLSLTSEIAAVQAQAELDRAERDRVIVQLRHEIQNQRTSILKADALIRGARQTKVSRLRQIGQLFSLLAPPQSEQALSDWVLPSGSFVLDHQSDPRPDEQPEARMTDDNQPTARNPYLRANSLAELCSFDDVDFVRCAYVTILGRQPDLDGEAYYADRIRRGHSKLEIAWQLRRSLEGKRHDPGISGLDRALKQAAWERKRLVGAAVRLLTRAEPDDRLEKMRRSLANELKLIRRGIDTSFQPVRESGHAAGTRVARRLESVSPVIKEVISKSGLSPAAQEALDILQSSKTR